MLLILETTTGKLVPSGEAIPLPRGGLHTVLVQFVTNSVAALLDGGAPVAVKLYSPADLVTPIATLDTFTAVPADLNYTGQFDTLSGGLAALERGTLLARISYGTPNVDSGLFHVNYGTGAAGGAAAPQIVITQPAGPVDYVQALGTFGGKLILDQVEGFYRVKAAGDMLGFQLAAQDAPTGADAVVEAIVNGVATGKTCKLTAGAKNEETVFGAALPLIVGDILRYKPTQIGSVKPGTNLSVGAILRLT
ncbi:MAG: hypothetical protein HY302_10560 [Opitutae bacterium]|nr:hypothetical protein [Opitutae bacterium]